MLAKTGLLVLSNPRQIGKILSTVRSHVKNTLYIQLLSALTEPFGNFHPKIFTSWPTYSQTIRGIYSEAAVHCRDLDVRVLLSGIKYESLSQIKTRTSIDLVIFDKTHEQEDITEFVTHKIHSLSLAKEYDVLTLDSGDFEPPQASEDGKIYNHVVLGGTFDHLHTAHKLLLSEGALRSERSITVGVTEEYMLSGKVLGELMQDNRTRIRAVFDFLMDICASLKISITPISDPYGPAIQDPSMSMIVVSEETIKGGEKINEIRTEKGLPPMDVFVVKLIEQPDVGSNEENKISSSNTRMRLLGTLLKPVVKKDLPASPYVIGLTGGVASGKTGVAKLLEELGAQSINCDLVGHDVYRSGKPCHGVLVQHFGEKILNADGEIDRKVLGAIVFNNPKEMQVLNEAVWPHIAAEVSAMINSSQSRVVVVEGAVLLTAGWDNFCHEVWTTIVPREEAVRRLMARNALSEEQAKVRLDSQTPNKTYVAGSNVVLCPLWDVDFTKEQVLRAWQLLQERLSD